MHNSATTAGAFALLILIVGAAFVYVSANPPEIPKEPSLGVTGNDLTPEIAEEMNLEQAQGILVIYVLPGTAADKAGLRGCRTVVEIQGTQIGIGGDVIIRVDDREIATHADLRSLLAQKEVGDSIDLTIIRGGQRLPINNIVLGDKSQDPAIPEQINCQ